MGLHEIGTTLSAWVDAKPVWASTLPVELPPEDDEQERDARGLGSAEGQSFIIEYRDSKGRVSRRRITVWHISESSRDGIPFLYARCHERQAMRTFRIDRIASCIDYDGEVHDDVPRYLADILGMSIGLATAKEDASARRWQLIVSDIRPDATLLAAISRCDGHVAASEVQEILSYLARVVEGGGEILNDDDVAALDRYVARLRPTSEAIRRALDAASSYSPDRIKRMLIAAARVMDADMKRHPAETRLVNTVAEELLGVTLV